MIRWHDPARRGWVVFGLVAALAAVVVCMHPVVSWALASRALRLKVETPGGRAWSGVLEWVKPDGGRQGYWVDLEAGAKAELRFDLPSYALRDVALRPDDGDEGVRVERAEVEPTVAGIALAPRPIGTAAAGGRVMLDLPGRAAWMGWPVRLGAAVVMGAVAFGVAGGLWRLGLWWDRWRGVGRVLPSRGLGWGLWVLIVLPPVWMVLWAPMLMEGDGTAFVWFAVLLWKTGSFVHFDGWRLPGYGTFITPFVGLMRDYSTGVGMAQAGLGVLTAWFVWDLLRRRVARGWACLGAAVVAMDPMLLMWQRHVLSETLAGVLAIAMVWGVDRAGRMAAWRGWMGMVVVPLVLGVLGAGAVYTRANFQLFVVVVPPVLVGMGVARGLGWRALVPGVVMGLVAAGLVVPAFVHNKAMLGAAELVVGADHNRCVFSWQNGTLEINQAGSVTHEEYRVLEARREAGELWELAYTDFLQNSPTIPVPPGTHPMLAKDVRSGVVTRESLARRPLGFVVRIVQGVPSVLGVQFRKPWYYSHTMDNMSRVLRGRFDHRTRTNFDDRMDLGIFPPEVRSVIERHIRPVDGYLESVNAKVFARLFEAYRALWPLVLVLFVCACVRHLRHPDGAMVLACVMVLGNAAAIAVVQYTGMDRYGVPFYPLTVVAAVAGVGSRPWGRRVWV